MKKIKKSAELLWVFGTVFVALGVAFCNKANLGVSMIAAPAFILQEALCGVLPILSVGVAEYLFQGVLLLVMCVLIRKFDWRYLLAFASAVIYGYTLNLFLRLLAPLEVTLLWQKWLFLLLGDVIVAFGVASFFRTYLPLQVYELFVAQTAKHFHKNINKTKWCFDLSLLAVSLILVLVLFSDVKEITLERLLGGSFHSIGLGTILTTLINSPIITALGKLIDRVFEPEPLFPECRTFLERR